MALASPSQGSPPLDAGVTTALSRDLFPPPHVTEQHDHSPNDPHIQSTGQASVLQALVSVSSPSHASPPLYLGVATFLLRVISPPPQDFEQVDHSPYNSHSQFTCYNVLSKKVEEKI